MQGRRSRDESESFTCRAGIARLSFRIFCLFTFFCSPQWECGALRKERSDLRAQVLRERLHLRDTLRDGLAAARLEAHDRLRVAFLDSFLEPVHVRDAERNLPVKPVNMCRMLVEARVDVRNRLLQVGEVLFSDLLLTDELDVVKVRLECS